MEHVCAVGPMCVWALICACMSGFGMDGWKDGKETSVVLPTHGKGKRINVCWPCTEDELLKYGQSSLTVTAVAIDLMMVCLKTTYIYV